MISLLFEKTIKLTGTLLGWAQDTITVLITPCLSQEEHVRRQMAKAKSYEEWRALASELDRLLGNDKWRHLPKSNDYDHKLIAARLEHLHSLRIENDIPAQMFFIRTGNIRSLGGIGKPNLYRKSQIGTKVIIEDYVAEVIQQLFQIAKAPDSIIQRRLKIDFFSELVQTFGRTVLILHGGASFGLCHLGAVKALYDKSMMPQIFCGSYVGAMIASLICVQPKEELRRILNGENIKFEAFYKKGPKGSFQRRLTRFLKYGRLFDIKVLEECARTNIGDVTFKEAYEISGLILNITVYAKRRHEVPVLLNYLTAPDLIIWTAACASLATPGMYEEVMLLYKREDGSINPWNPSAVKLESARMVQEAPVKRLTELFNANNFIVSQVPSYLTWRPLRAERYQSSIIGSMSSFIFGEIAHRFKQLKELGLIPDFLMNMLNLIQAPIVGDIQITPNIFCSDIQYLLANPEPTFVQYCIRKGELATWKRLAQIEMRCSIEFAIIEILQSLSLPSKKYTNDNSM